MSLRVLVIAIFCILGMLAASVVIFEGISMRSAFEQAQLNTLSRVIKISSKEVLRQTTDLMAELAAGSQLDRGFKKALKKFMKHPESKEYEKIVMDFMDEQYHQKMVTAGIIDLKKIRLYDLNLKLVAQSSEGVEGLQPRLPDSIFQLAKPRKKAERLKHLHAIWQEGNQAYMSLLAPVGGLLIKGYMEVVVDPTYNLHKLEAMMGIPIKLIEPDGEVRYESENWESMMGESTLVVNYDLLDQSDAPALHIQGLENLQAMYASIFKTESLVAGVFAGVFGLGIFAALFVMRRYVFIPMQQIVGNLSKVADGDMNIEISENEKIREIKTLNHALDHVASNLSGKLSEILQIGEMLTDSSHDLSEQAGRSVAIAQQQTREVEQLQSATERLVQSSESVHENAVSTALAGSDAEEKTSAGQDVISGAEASMSKMSSQIKLATGSLDILKQNVENVGSILESIQTIAEQTNLLALNAAIESARAGENGRGFAVVADEVRQLAGRTQNATQEVVHVLKELTDSAEKAEIAMNQGEAYVQDSVERVHKTKVALQEITAHVNEIVEMNTTIVSAANNQASISVENKNSIDGLSNVAKDMAQDAENLTNRSSSLASMADQLSALVHSFKIRQGR